MVAATGLIIAAWHTSLDETLQADTAPEPETEHPTDFMSRILSARGVEYRRGDHGPWQQARSGDRLSRGDWIKSSASGTAKVRFPSGAIFVLPPATVGRLDQLAAIGARAKPADETTGFDFQWVEIETAEAPSEPPTGPRLIVPDGDHEIDLTTQQQLRLAWETVPAASRYALNVSASPSFASNIIDDDRRRKPSTKIGIRSTGVFYWRVAAIGRDGSQGAWSEVRSFRVRG